jgi:putative Mg2+ transporter-C (MgtC) family protein
MAAIGDFFRTEPTLPHLLLALLLGALIGLERQIRQRTAGLRTNALVCLGAAAFVDLAGTIGNAGGVIQVTAYVVSGVGFLGAGAIMKEGVNIRGLNTAATLWCSAAVGASAGAGAVLAASSLATLVIITNLFLRSLIGLIDRRTYGIAEDDAHYTLRVTCSAAEEARIRAQLLQGFTQNSITLRGLESADTQRIGQVEVRASCDAPRSREPAIEQIAGHLSLEPSVSAVQWGVTVEEG